MSDTPRTDQAWRACPHQGDGYEMAVWMREHAKEVERELAEMEARAMSLATHLPPETLAGDVQKWRDEAKGLLLNHPRT